jgi:hypothetical protein
VKIEMHALAALEGGKPLVLNLEKGKGKAGYRYEGHTRFFVFDNTGKLIEQKGSLVQVYPFTVIGELTSTNVGTMTMVVYSHITEHISEVITAVPGVKGIHIYFGNILPSNENQLTQDIGIMAWS